MIWGSTTLVQTENSALLETDLLRSFVAIVETGSFAAAASHVHRTPSAISMQMKRLEEIVGQRLFEKSGRSVAVTRQGELLLSYSRQILQLNHEAIARFRTPPLEGRLAFGAPDDFGTRFVPRILARFAETHPDVNVDVVLGPSVDLQARLDAGELDLTLVTSSAGRNVAAAGTVIFAERLLWVGLKGGIARRRLPTPLALAGLDCVWRAAALMALDSEGVRYRVSYTSESAQGQLAAILADLAIAPLPQSLVDERLEVVGLDGSLPELGRYELRLLEVPSPSSAARVFARHVVASFAEP